MNASANQPLAGLKVIELHAIGPVPFAGQLLCSLGAQVTRVSPPADPALGVAMRLEYDLLNAGKERLAVDMKSPAGLEQVIELLEPADVLLEGFRPGVLERLGLDPKTLLVRCPRLVIGRLSGWGLKGAMAERAGHDINYLALAGVLNAIGQKDTPVPPLNVVADFGGGAMHLLVGVLAKLVQRSITGTGGTVETSILAGTVGLTPMFYGLLAGGIWRLPRHSNLLDGAMPFYRVYKTSDQRFVSVGALEAKFYRELLDVMGLAGEIDAKQQHVAATWPATIERFTSRFAERSRDEWARLGEARDCCLAPVLDFIEAAAYRHNLDNGLYTNEPFAKPATTIVFDRAG